MIKSCARFVVMNMTEMIANEKRVGSKWKVLPKVWGLVSNDKACLKCGE